VTRRIKIEFGCDYCAEDQNRWYGHVTQIGVDNERGTILLRCPRCGALYETTVDDDQLRRLTPGEAAKIYPNSL